MCVCGIGISPRPVLPRASVRTDAPALVYVCSSSGENDRQGFDGKRIGVCFPLFDFLFLHLQEAVVGRLTGKVEMGREGKDGRDETYRGLAVKRDVPCHVTFYVSRPDARL